MSTPSSYDHIPYPGRAYKETHPDHLAAIATLYGIKPPDVRRCRVLEIGCGDGSNLIPMAVGLPDSDFTGVELASQPVEIATRIVAASGLKNVRVQRFNLLDITKDFGTFDYIIAHGVYSWVPKNVREHLLRVCRNNLSPNGIAFVSYNTYPAGYVRRACREMIHFHLGAGFEAVDAVEQGKHFLKLMVDTVEGQDLWTSMLRSELQRLNIRHDDRVTHHDEFSPSYKPVYFHIFAREAEREGLQFVSEAKARDALQPQVSQNVLAKAEKLGGGDSIRFQQYLDLFSFNGFRGSLLCRDDVVIERGKLAANLSSLSLASPLTKLEAQKDGAVEYKNRRGPGTISTNDVGIITALGCLEDKWPQSVSYETLLQTGVTRRSDKQSSTTIAEGLLRLAASSLVDLRSHTFLLPDAVDMTPIASPLARLQAAEGQLVTTLLHSHVEIPDQRIRRVLQLLDGTHDTKSLTRTFLGDYPASSRSAIEDQLNTAS